MSSKLRPRMSSTWTSEREEEFVAMMEAKPELFDNTEMNFSNKTVKMNAWLEMAEHFRLSEKELRKKWDSLRTQYSRYTKMYAAGGVDGRLCTARQKWILQRLKFLDPHIKRRSSYCNDLDYEVTVVENSCDELSPAQVDVELDSDSLSGAQLHQAANSDGEINADTFKTQMSKRLFQDDERVSMNSPHSQGGSKRHCGGRENMSILSVPPVLTTRECENDDEELDSSSLRRMVCSTVEEQKRDDCWDMFGRYVVSCLRSLESPRSRIKAQNELCAVLQKHIEREEEEGDEPSEKKEKQMNSCSGCSGSSGVKASTNSNTNPHTHCEPRAPADEDDQEPFLKSMSIIMKRLPQSVRAEVKFRIHELVHRAEMKHLYEQTDSQNTTTPGQESGWENGLNYNLI
ncbi:uncharacterized protein LOC103025277 [Astyanax mexicanus]|uniref:uncharacterized protein LOC103025277 n=1 Tax=Astyanax mexicanus TaxID=7994 RepID=UPI0020CAFF05|nr:uncharacterized protein LOC103025277 [Astyanax mexicanus]